MIYNLVIYIYLFGVKVAGLFSAKPAKMVKGHREVFDILRNKICLSTLRVMSVGL